MDFGSNRRKTRFIGLILFLLVIMSFNTFIVSCEAEKAKKTDNTFFKVSPGDIYIYNINMSVKQWTVNVIYNEYFDSSETSYYERDNELVSYKFFKSDTRVSVEYIENDVTVYGHLHYNNRTVATKDLQWFFVLKEYALDYIENTPNRTIIRNYEKRQITLVENKNDFKINKTYDLDTFTLIEYHSFNVDTKEWFSLSLIAKGHGLFGIYPTDSFLIMSFLLIAISLVFLSVTLRLLPDNETFASIKIDNSIFQTVWMKTMFFDTIEAIKAFQKKSKYYNSELAVLMIIALLSNIVYRILTYAQRTIGMIHIFSIIIPFALIALLRLFVWVVFALLLTYLFHYRKAKEEKLTSMKFISKGIFYMYGVYESVYVLLSWALILKNDITASGTSAAPELIHYGSFSKSFAPLLGFILNILTELGWFILLIWAAAAFLLTFFKFSISKGNYQFYLEEGILKNLEPIILTLFLGGVWVAAVFITELLLIPNLIEVLI